MQKESSPYSHTWLTPGACLVMSIITMQQMEVDIFGMENKSSAERSIRGTDEAPTATANRWANMLTDIPTKKTAESADILSIFPRLLDIPGLIDQHFGLLFGDATFAKLVYPHKAKGYCTEPWPHTDY
ncbi:hypothetical protein QQF64_018926 [Cirrhinus molitorella]|uniref:Uncharacterized protein n=1 Tax=Cirrhinus molitorella TaxID=172907 RepID=A0ABR3LFG2_9TELE